MRSHRQIIHDIGSARIAELTGVSLHTARSWEQRDSLPAKYWQTVIGTGLCQADELIVGASHRESMR